MTTADDLKAQEAFNFALFQHNPAPMIVVDRNGCVVKSNLARRAMDESLPELGAPLFAPTDGPIHAELASALTDCMHSGTVRDFPECRLRERWVAVSMAPFPQGAVVVMNDITARKHAEAEAELQREQLIQADKMVALGSLVSGVAHEISNPNNAMLLSSAVIKRMCVDIIPILDRVRETEGEFVVGSRDYDEIREELPELIDVVTRAAKRIKSFVDDLKAYARKRPDTLNESVDINAVLDSACSLLSVMIRHATNSFTSEKAEALPPVAGNAQRIEQVIINLLSNACQALPDKHASLAVSTRLDASTSEVIIEVRDTGQGIKPEDLTQIMDPFFTTKKDTGGTGLGLSISKTIIDQHGGQLLFVSEPGQGTVATIRLPSVARHDTVTPSEKDS
ncbi:MAG: ATP-binding protein [Verrucomicrobia bacterium]|nr:ATP-binding protein [Verrucomicrobiota bacterium]